MIKTKTETELVDDLDKTVGGTVATRSFALGADVRWIELSDENWNAFVAALDPWLKASRKAPKTAVRKGRGGPSAGADAATRAFNKAARRWAIDAGKIDASRGRLSEALKDEYRAATQAGPADVPVMPDQ